MEDIEKLAEDIEENGLYHNLLVRPIEGGKYEIISGERRYRAHKLLNRKTVPCNVREELKNNDIDMEIQLHKANHETRELSEMERARSVQRLEELYKLKRKMGFKIEGKIRDVIGQDMKLSGAQVQRLKKLNSLIPELQE
ncbi:hypothetical protein DU75_03500, partial [Methanosarcina mazei]